MVPKINVYLPDDLAEAVKDAGIPVSAVCQRALESAVRRIAALRESVAGGEFDPEDPASLTQYTQRARNVVKRAQDLARAEGAPLVATRHLLDALLAEEGNLALRVLSALEIAPAAVRRELTRRAEIEQGTEGGGPAFSSAAAGALELTATEAVGLGHNYVGCEHLLLGLVGEPEGVAGHTLRALGAEYRATRRAISAAVAGFVHLRAQESAAQAPPVDKEQFARLLSAAVQRELAPIVGRLERLEQRQSL
ncbi:Clp protease N-terminal domain-containing protein [Streptomyces litchfieldiae]|uniref:Clp protease N-terminal domain-containing protein n=1 Tax=Streptomyces litchfieldiae TaxID=3075543 RepID=A0ABU2MRE1_9ACTN|nr:Clp protease N-terminal domain-containing protein [Streptomyces sp. DSM 44938]MDT0344193.1 Clp protease N-terminal domain-containing protein [Streptomyces sp. DSM 44938]